MQNVDLLRHKLALVINSNRAVLAGIDQRPPLGIGRISALGIRFDRHSCHLEPHPIQSLETDLKRTGCRSTLGRCPIFRHGMFYPDQPVRNFKLRRLFSRYAIDWHCER